MWSCKFYETWRYHRVSDRVDEVDLE